VIDSGTRQVVLVVKGEGRFEPRAVKPDRRGDGCVEVQQSATSAAGPALRGSNLFFELLLCFGIDKRPNTRNPAGLVL
jgi:hypothetical protein